MTLCVDTTIKAVKTKYLLFLLAMATYFNVSAQEFAPYGAEWHYTVIDKLDITYHQAKSVDSIEIEGKKCRIIEVDHSCFLSDDVIIYSTANGDSVFWYEPNSEKFQLIYAFNAQPGDSWSFAVKSVYYDSLSKTDSVVFYVDSIGQRDVNGFLLPELYITSTYTHNSSSVAGPLTITLIKSIGAKGAIFRILTQGMMLSCHLPSPRQLRCYEDSYIGFYETGIADSCTYEKTGTFTGELEEESEEVRLYPNPANNTLNISHQNGILRSVVIYDLSGREVLAQPVSDAAEREHRLNLSSLPAGAYVVKVETGDKSVIKKLVVNK